MHPFSQSSLRKTVAPDEREAEPGAGLLGNVKCTLRGLEALGSHKDWFGRSWEGLLGRPWPRGLERVHWQVLRRRGLVERLRDIIISAHQITDCCLVFEDCASISPWVARVPFPAHEAGRPSCSSSVVSSIPNQECCAR